MAGLRWAVRGSFLRYVSALPDGRCRVAAGATLVEGPAFSFPRVGDPDPGAVDLVHRFTGTVEFTAHLGMLSLRIAEPWLDWSGDTPVITIAGPDQSRIRLATCLLASDPATRVWHGREVRLTQDGAELFGGSYAVGALLDPFQMATHELPAHRAPEMAGATRP